MMLTYIAKRVIQIVPIVLIIIVVNFALIHLAPGNPIDYLIGEGSPTPEYIDMIKRQFGLDKPLYEQLGIYMLNVLSGNLGSSLARQTPVLTIIFARVPATLLLVFSALLWACLFGILLGIVCAIRPNSLIDRLATVVSLSGYSMPLFWLGQILILVFGVQLGLLPLNGMTSVRGELSQLGYVLDVLWHLILPSVTVGLWYLALFTQFSKIHLTEALHQDYILTARSKGLSRRSVIIRHALRNSLLPVVTIVGEHIGYALAGATLVETVFGWPGLGRLMYESILLRDYPVILGLLFMISIMTCAMNVVVDVSYALIDPRIRYGGK
jgi:peptide/nickel transport system permease protein